MKHAILITGRRKLVIGRGGTEKTSSIQFQASYLDEKK